MIKLWLITMKPDFPSWMIGQYHVIIPRGRFNINERHSTYCIQKNIYTLLTFDWTTSFICQISNSLQRQWLWFICTREFQVSSMTRDVSNGPGIRNLNHAFSCAVSQAEATDWNPGWHRDGNSRQHVVRSVVQLCPARSRTRLRSFQSPTPRPRRSGTGDLSMGSNFKGLITGTAGLHSRGGTEDLRAKISTQDSYLWEDLYVYLFI